MSCRTGAKRLPLLTLLVVWWVLTGLMTQPGLHAVPIAPREQVEAATGASRSAPDLAAAFETWVRAQPELANGAEEGSSQPPIPLVLISAHGGGIRAAFWTALVLDCLVGRTRVSQPPTERPICATPRRSSDEIRSAAGRVMLASGVSGGSVGLAAYAQHMRHGNPVSDGWVRQTLGSDFASPTIGWGLFHDLPNRLLGMPTDRDCKGAGPPPCFRQDRAGTLSASIEAGN